MVGLCILTVLFGWYTKAHCLDDRAWTDGEEYASWCYNDPFPLWGVERLAEGAVPYLDHPVEYPVLTGLQMWVAQQGVQAIGGDGTTFYHLTALIDGVAALGVLVLLASTGLPRRRLLWWALAPSMIVYMSLNWDPLPVACLVAAVALHLRDRNLASGVAAGLGVAAKLTPGVVIPFIALGLLRVGRPREAAKHVGGAAAAWLVVNLPVALAAPEGWRRFYALNRERTANFESLWYLAQELRDAQFDVGTINNLSALLVVVGWSIIVLVGGRRRPPSQWWSLALPALVWFLLVNKVYSPQYSLWILPLMAMSLRRFGPFVAFLIADLAVFGVSYPFFLSLSGTPGAPGYSILAAAALLRAAVLLWILVESTLDHDDGLVEQRWTEVATNEGAGDAGGQADAGTRVGASA